MPEASPLYYKVIRGIDAFTEIFGNAVAWIMVPMVAIVTYEVFARYLFDAPTMWAYDLTYMLYGSLFMLGASFALKRGAHIRTDILWQNFSERKKGIIDTLAYVLFFFPALIMLFVSSVDDAWHAMLMGERSEQTAWRPYLWPFKMVVPATAALLLLQGVAETMKTILQWRTGKEFEHKEGAEL